MINSNIVFGILVFMAVQNTIKTFINFGSMMEYDKYNIKKPLNFYGLTKKIYEEILDYLRWSDRADFWAFFHQCWNLLPLSYHLKLKYPNLYLQKYETY